MNNAGDGNLAVGLVNSNVTPVLAAMQRTMAERLPPSADPYRELALQEPFMVRTAPDRVLPPKSGAGLTPFYLALVTILIGFIGASTIHPSIDAAIGFAPSEVGPMTSRRPYLRATRTTTLLAKLAVLLAVAPIAAALLQLIATTVIGVDGSAARHVAAAHRGHRGRRRRSAVGIRDLRWSGRADQPVLRRRALPRLGPGGPRRGAIWLAPHVDVDHRDAPILDGVRAMVFFDGRREAGLTHAWSRIGIGAAVGIALGVATTWHYDRNPRFSRHPDAERPVVAEPAPAKVGH
ncbi:hypothetical protein AB0C47_16000 [Micromonospora taraxaci]|uniref:hypothetical protein n=1 Tax=Micromonospora taraxaci TaxID=1316803 RepID=UPI0033F89485